MTVHEFVRMQVLTQFQFFPLEDIPKRQSEYRQVRKSCTTGLPLYRNTTGEFTCNVSNLENLFAYLLVTSL